MGFGQALIRGRLDVETLWGVLGHSGAFRDALGRSGPFWVALGRSGAFSAPGDLGRSGSFWGSLGRSGGFWVALGRSGALWSVRPLSGLGRTLSGLGRTLSRRSRTLSELSPAQKIRKNLGQKNVRFIYTFTSKYSIFRRQRPGAFLLDFRTFRIRFIFKGSAICFKAIPAPEERFLESSSFCAFFSPNLEPFAKMPQKV